MTHYIHINTGGDKSHPWTSTVAVFKTITSSKLLDSRRSQTERSKRLNMSVSPFPPILLLNVYTSYTA